MRKALDIEDVEELEFRSRTPEQQRTAAEILVGWAAERHPDDGEEVTPALLLVKAGEHLESAGDPRRALELYARAQTAGGDVPPDVRCYLHHGLIDAGDLAEARRLAEEVRRSRPADPDVYVSIAGDYETAGDLKEANRWMNLGLRRLIAEAENGELEGLQALILLSMRRRIRRALGFLPDEFDENPLLPPPMDLSE